MQMNYTLSSQIDYSRLPDSVANSLEEKKQKNYTI